MADLTAKIGADISPLQKELIKAQSALKRFASQVAQIARRLAKFAAAAAATGAAIAAALVTKSLAAIDAQAKLARRLGTTTDSLGILERAAGLSGVAMSDLEQVAIRQNRVLGEAIRGYGQGAEALDRLGLSAQELANLPLDQRLQVIARRMQELNLNAAQQADVLAQLGDRQGRLFNLMEDGASVLERATVEARAFGLAVSDVDAAQIERANDALSVIGDVIQGIGNRIAVYLAPYLEAIGNELTDAAVASQGFKQEIDGAFTFIAKAIGWVNDRFYDFQVLLKTLQVAAYGIGNAIIQGFAAAEEVVRGFFDRQTENINAFYDAVNKIPGISLEPFVAPSQREGGQDVTRLALESRQALAEVRQELNEMLAGGRPSAGVEAWLEQVRTAARMATKETIEQRQILSDTTAAIDSEDEARAGEKAKREAEQRLRDLESFKSSLLTEEEAQIESHGRRLEELIAYRENELLAEEEFAALKERLAEEHEGRLVEIRKRGLSRQEVFAAKSWGEQTKQVVGSLADMVSGVAAGNKKLFAIQKAAAIAGAILDAHKGIARTMAEYPMPIAAAMAAAHGAMAFARVATIKSQQFSGGSSGGGGGTTAVASGGTASPAAGGSAAGGANQALFVQGISPADLFSGDQVRNLAEALLDFQRDGGRVVIS